MIRTKNPELASEKVNAAIDALASKLGEHIMVAPVPEIETGGFRSMFHPMMMMLQIKPVIGMHEEWLVIGTTPDSVKQCLAAAAGKTPSFRTNKRYLREGLSIDGKVCSASFADRSTLGQELAMACAMGGMWSTFIPENEGTRPIKAIFGMMGRLSPVLAEIDFFSSTSSVCTFSDGMWRGRSVTTYKPLPAKTIEIEVEKLVPGPTFGANDAE
ncbi:MAG: hypothetical protein IID39_10130 [Planctomycetes bacterium]|nr:hypothetical protein [Planctomycetota bacterium]